MTAGAAKTQLSVVVPVYKAEGHISHLIESMIQWNKKSPFDLSVILVDDGSQDKALEIALQQLKTATFNYVFIRLMENCGQATATAVGLHYANTPWIATIDDDLQHSPETIEKLFENAIRNQADLVYGAFEQIKHSRSRQWASVFVRSVTQLLGFDYSKVTSLRLFKHSVAVPYRLNLEASFFIDPWLLKNALKWSYQEVRHNKRTNSESRYSLKKLINMTLKVWVTHSKLNRIKMFRDWTVNDLKLPKPVWFASNDPFQLVPLEVHHLELLRQWRNSDFVRLEMEYQEIITVEAQKNWFENLKEHQKYFIHRYKGEYIGMSHVDAESGDTGGFLKDAQWKGSGVSIGTALKMIDFSFNQLYLNQLKVKVNRNNAAAVSLNSSFGYQYKESLNNEFDLYQLTRESFSHHESKIRKLVKFLE